MARVRLCTRVRELRSARRWSLAELAQMSGVPLSTVARWDANAVSLFDGHVLDQLARAFDVDPGYLIRRCTSADAPPKKRVR
jgi:transcriptional regulator with XRE-family HTH domain